MKQKNILVTALVAIAVISFSSCKIEEVTNPSNEVEFGSAEIQYIVEANLNTTNDTLENGNPTIMLEPVEGVTVIATIDKRNFYATPSGSYEDEVVSGTTDANGLVKLMVPVGENSNINYTIKLSDKLVKQRTSTSVNDEPIDKIATYTRNENAFVSKGTTVISKLEMTFK